MDHPLFVGFCVGLCFGMHYFIFFQIAIILKLKSKRELVAWLLLSFVCLVTVNICEIRVNASHLPLMDKKQQQKQYICLSVFGRRNYLRGINSVLACSCFLLHSTIFGHEEQIEVLNSNSK